MSDDLGYLDRSIAGNAELNSRVLSLALAADRQTQSNEMDSVFDSRRDTQIGFYRGVGDDAVLIGTITAESLEGPYATEVSPGIRRDSLELAFPEWLAYKIRSHFGRDSFARPIYLRFRDREGYLSMAPWERALESLLGMPILRLPYFAMPTRMLPRPRLGVILDSLDLTAWRKSFHDLHPYFWRAFYYSAGDAGYPQGGFLDVFGPASQLAQRDVLHKLFGPFLKFAKLHPWPDEFTHDEVSQSDESFAVRHPVLRWISSRTANDSIDYVILACGATFQRSRGALVFSGTDKTPEEFRVSPMSRAIEAEEFSSFLMQLGAWGTSLIVPADTAHSEPSLRMFADELMQLRPAPCNVISTISDIIVALTTHFVLPSRDSNNTNFSVYLLMLTIEKLHNFEYEYNSKLSYRLDEWIRQFGFDSWRAEVSKFANTDGSFGQQWSQRFTFLNSLTDHAPERSEDRPPRWQVAAQRILEARAALLLEDSVRSSKSPAVLDGQTRAIKRLAEIIKRYIANTEGKSTLESGS